MKSARAITERNGNGAGPVFSRRDLNMLKQDILGGCDG
jgi:hypothetical protein